MKVLHVITGLGTGGAETALCRLLETLPRAEFEHVVVALGDQGALSARVGAVAELHHLKMNPSRPSPRDLWRLRRVVRASQPDIVHGWMYHANIAATMASAGLGIPLLWGIRHSIHDLADEKRLTRMVIRGGALLSRRPVHILYNSAVSARQHEAAGYEQSRTCLIPNGFDTSVFAPNPEWRQRIRAEWALPEESLVIGLVARVHPVKDHANFLRAAACFAPLCPQALFVLVGEGADSDNAALTSLVGQSGLEHRVRLCGRRTDIAAINSALDVATLSSRSEAFPNAVGEAMACGVPCVATDVGDVLQIIGDTGVVVRSRDATSLAEGWAQMAALDRPTRQVLGLRARQRIVDHYSLQAVSRQYADIYTSVLRNN